MPNGSIGRAYYDFVHREDLTADGLVASSKDTRVNDLFTADERWTADRLRDIHDLQHVLTGYGRDPVGELSLLAFMTTQVPNRGIDFIIFMAKRKYQQEMPELDIGALVAEGRRLGKEAAWMLAVPWEDRLQESLDAVRAEMGFAPAATYHAAVDSWTTLAEAA
jgi:ubiquinone biosynthesis protein COQ4